MIREAFKLVIANERGLPLGLPYIQKVNIIDQDGVSWREAKKQLRQWYLDQAAALRKVSEQQYFGPGYHDLEEEYEGAAGYLDQFDSQVNNS